MEDTLKVFRFLTTNIDQAGYGYIDAFTRAEAIASIEEDGHECTLCEFMPGSDDIDGPGALDYMYGRA